VKIFISWSGERSRLVAEALRDWLVLVIHIVEPWVFTRDIQAGSRWNEEVARQLEVTKFGILCVTQDNINSPWLLFEAGALAKTLDNSLVCPFLLDLDYSDIQGPLVQFQGARSEPDATWKLVRSIYQASGIHTLSETQLHTTFERFWPDLDANLTSIRKLPTGERHVALQRRSDRELLEEALQLLRALHRPDVQTSVTRKSSENIILDLNELGMGEVTIKIDSNGSSTFQDFLNTLYGRYLHRVADESTYGQQWTLQNLHSGEDLHKVGRQDHRS
jgi:TIR domain